MQKRNLTKVELDTCEMVAKTMKHQDATVSIPAEVLYNLAREVKLSRHKLAKAGAVKAQLKKTLEEMTAQWEKLNIDPFKVKKEEAASTAMDTTSSVELTTPTQSIIPQEARIEQYLREKHMQNDSLEEFLKDNPDITKDEYYSVLDKFFVRLIRESQAAWEAEDREGGAENDQP